MIKFIAVLAVLATSMVSATIVDVPKLHHTSNNNKAVIGGSRLIQLQACNGTACTNCETILEFQPNKCHPSLRHIDHGEILSEHPAPSRRQCFTETAFDNHLHTGPTCDATAMVESAPRECDVCSQDVFGDPLKFFKYTGCDTSSSTGTVTLHRGCDWGCKNCDLIVPMRFNQCVDAPGHAFFRDFTFQISNPGECSADIKADHFFIPTCAGEPNYVDTVFTDRCYFFAGRQHKFVLA